MISVFGPSIRPHLWMRLYESLVHNKHAFELVFAGDKKPDFEFPNITFIYSPTKPSQCAQIASLNCRGEYMLFCGDDFIFTPGSLDRIVSLLKKPKNKNNIVTPWLRSRIITDSGWGGEGLVKDRKHRWLKMHAFGRATKKYLKHGMFVPIMPNGGMGITRRLWNKTGGVDSTFVGGHWDWDVAMRVYAMGGEVVICDNACGTEIKPLDHPGLYGSDDDVSLCASLWCVRAERPDYRYSADNRILVTKQCIKKRAVLYTKQRSVKVVPFINNETLLTSTQGAKGKYP